MDKALRYELSFITELDKKIFPTHAPEGKVAPYLVYIKSNFNQLKTFEGITKNIEASYLLNVFSPTYSQLHDLTKKVRERLESFPLRYVGLDGIYIQDLTINNIAETYEHELLLYRSVIDIQLSYKEE